jgi:hypothetical protein
VEGGAVGTDDYGARDNAFTGDVLWGQIDVAAAAADEDHRIMPEELLRVAMARQ